MNRVDPLSAATEIAAHRYGGAAVVFLAGSVMRGEGTDTSDLDLVVVYERLDAAYRESFRYTDWPVEAFVHDPQTLRYFFLQVDRPSGVPSLPHMVATGTPLPRATNLSRALQSFAREVLVRGPQRWSKERLGQSRYTITSLVDDLRSPRSRTELLASGAALYSALADHILRGQGQWSASGKSIPRQLAAGAPALANRFEEAFDLLFACGRTDAVTDLCAQVLAPSGGWLFDGYKSVVPSDWRLKAHEPAHDEVFSALPFPPQDE